MYIRREVKETRTDAKTDTWLEEQAHAQQT